MRRMRAAPFQAAPFDAESPRSRESFESRLRTARPAFVMWSKEETRKCP
jgi:hypothetical protein